MACNTCREIFGGSKNKPWPWVACFSVRSHDYLLSINLLPKAQLQYYKYINKCMMMLTPSSVRECLHTTICAFMCVCVCVYTIQCTLSPLSQLLTLILTRDNMAFPTGFLLDQKVHGLYDVHTFDLY